MLSSSGYSLFSQPEICSGEQSSCSFRASTSRKKWFVASRHLLGGRALSSTPSRAPSEPGSFCDRRGGSPPGTRWKHSAAQPSGDRTKGISGSESPGELLPFARSERASAPTPLGRRDPSGGLEHPVDGAGGGFCSARAMSLMASPALYRFHSSFLPAADNPPGRPSLATPAPPVQATPKT